MSQIPDLDCPQWRKPMRKVCPRCPWWVKVEGTDPQTQQHRSEHMCAIPATFLAMIAVARNTNETTASVQNVRNDAATEREAQIRLLQTQLLRRPALGGVTDPLLLGKQDG